MHVVQRLSISMEKQAFYTILVSLDFDRFHASVRIHGDPLNRGVKAKHLFGFGSTIVSLAEIFSVIPTNLLF